MTSPDFPKIPWHKKVRYQVEGYRIGLRWDCPSLDELMASLVLPNFRFTEDTELDAQFSILRREGSYELYINQTSEWVHTIDIMDHALRSAIQLEVATYAPDAVFVHAGVVRWKQQLLVLPGRSYAGKSTLVHALVELGAEYYSDEYAVVDEHGLVRPWPRPISIRDQSGRNNTPARELGWRPEFGPTKVALVAVTEFKSGAEWAPQELTPAQSVMELLSNTVSAQISPQRALSYLPRITTQALNLKGPRGEAKETAAAMLALL